MVWPAEDKQKTAIHDKSAQAPFQLQLVLCADMIVDDARETPPGGSGRNRSAFTKDAGSQEAIRRILSRMGVSSSGEGVRASAVSPGLGVRLVAATWWETANP